MSFFSTIYILKNIQYNIITVYTELPIIGERCNEITLIVAAATVGGGCVILLLQT